ncbi:MAG: hypothetical protein K2P94_06470 [Rhodospirillaceae bacterium]|nr:hypothetical protein [Rhodospirillaceae bacterium]
MEKHKSLSYLPTMFAVCMLFQVIYLACLALWAFFPDLKGHALLLDIFPQFALLDVFNFFYGLIASAIYGWLVAATFVFFFNLWPNLACIIFGTKTETQ